MYTYTHRAWRRAAGTRRRAPSSGIAIGIVSIILIVAILLIVATIIFYQFYNSGCLRGDSPRVPSCGIAIGGCECCIIAITINTIIIAISINSNSYIDS